MDVEEFCSALSTEYKRKVNSDSDVHRDLNVGGDDLDDLMYFIGTNCNLQIRAGVDLEPSFPPEWAYGFWGLFFRRKLRRLSIQQLWDFLEPIN
jgi:hypothetical protein